MHILSSRSNQQEAPVLNNDNEEENNNTELVQPEVNSDKLVEIDVCPRQ